MRRLVEAGMRVVIFDRDIDRGEALAKELNGALRFPPK